MRKNRMEIFGRLKDAAGYQRKAVLALFPENTRKHLEVIEAEVCQMMSECAQAHIKDRKPAEDAGTGSKSKKVEIL